MKNQLIQTIRGICIICVVLIHSLIQDDSIKCSNEVNIIIRTVINFAVGTFIFFAGYFVKVEEVQFNKSSFYIKKAKRLLVPYVIWSIVYIVGLHMEYLREKNIKGIILAFVLGKSATHLYYIIALIQLVIITPILVWVINKKNKGLDAVVLIISPLYAIGNGIFNYYLKTNILLYATLFFAWISFYYIGILLKNRKYEIKKCFTIGIGIITYLIFVMATNIAEYKNGFSYAYCTSQIKFTNSIYIILVCIVIFCMIKKFSQSDIKENCLSRIGDMSFGIYLIHLLFVTIYKKVFELANWMIFAEELSICMLSLVSSILVILICNFITKGKIKQYIGF